MDKSIWFWLIVGGVFALAILKTHAEHRAYAAAKETYRAALAALADDPANTALRRDALHKGRILAAAGRRLNARAKTPRVSVHDELAIRNDLDAIHAGVPTAPAGIAEGLARLAALQREGVLTPAEFTQLKHRMTRRPTGVEDLIRLLRGLKALEREGVLTEGEFEIKKWDILSKRMRDD
ncbi:hypothetical protein [Thiocapsa roseopersicina]|uniref:Short C-terminal domain-containing protein n=1 Tax=Thiocapsa roseopersicina TaxID=1058 RepID=A0A1H2RTU2_THIRO|nr:hypothetical protein [Thiocapsa roseopersicina]SDW22698.1 hypothetical protein SAMN05421783_102168 [Thiocapsa roseopersicina]